MLNLRNDRKVIYKDKNFRDFRIELKNNEIARFFNITAVFLIQSG